MMGATTNGGRARRPKVPVVATLSKGLVGPARGDEGERDGHEEGDDLRDDDELDVDGVAGGDDVGDGLVVEVRVAEVAVEDGGEPGRVLVPQRLVETQLLVEERRRCGRWRPARG